MASNETRIGRLLAALLVALLASTAAAAEDRGAQLYTFCSQCHGENGQGNEAFLAPAIAGLPQWYVQEQLGKFRQGWRGAHFDDIPGMRMRPMSLWLRSDEDVAAVAGHVAAMPRTNPAPVLTGGNATAGQQLYAPCITCHQVDGGGNEQLKAPPLRGASDWYLLSSLERYKARVRGSHPSDQYGVLMTSMAATLADEQAMKDVIAHIMTLTQ